MPKKHKTLIGQLSISGGWFFAGMVCIFYGSLYQGELLGKGNVSIGRNGAYVTVAGENAQININFFWVGAVIFFAAALTQLIITARRELKNPLPFDGQDMLVICPKCEEPFSLEELENADCPNCHIGLVKLKGFYDNK